MSSHVRVVPLSGGLSSVRDGVCVLLEIDDAKILLDCGWTASLNPDDLSLLRRHAREIDCVLLSHSTMRHCGALPYAYARLGLSCPVYASVPVACLARYTVLDSVCAARLNRGYSELHTVDINAAFSRITVLKYMQPHALNGRASGTTITAYSAGHTVGGTIWKITRDTDHIVYAVDFNHRKERHLSPSCIFAGAVPAAPLMRPSLLICGAKYASEYSSYKTRHQVLIASAIDVLSQGSCVLIPVDAASRVLELLLAIDHHWAVNQSSKGTIASLSFPVVFVSPTSSHLLHSVRGMLEWFSESLTKSFSCSREAPFDLKHISTVPSIDMPTRPTLILATDDSLEGNCHSLFTQFCQTKGNLLILPTRSYPNSLNDIITTNVLAQLAIKKDDLKAPLISLPFPSSNPVSLIDPIVKYSKWEIKEEEASNKVLNAKVLQNQVNLRTVSFIDEEENSDDQDEMEIQIEIENYSAETLHQTPADTPLNVNFTKTPLIANPLKEHTKTQQPDKNVAIFVGFDAKVADNKYAKFPFTAHRRRFDEYGEIVRIDSFLTESDRHDRRAAQLNAAMAQHTIKAPQLDPLSINSKTIKEGHLPDLTNLIDGIQQSKHTYHLVESLISINCRIQLFDLEGLSDMRSMATIIPQLQAKRIILTASTDILMSKSLANELSALNVNQPLNGESVIVSTASLAQQVKLTDALVSATNMYRIGDYEVGLLAGKARQADADSSVPVLDAPTIHSVVRPRPVVLGSVRLSEFKVILDRAGFTTRFRGGVLFVNNCVGISKSPTGDLILEGGVSSDYYAVRRLLYEQHAVIAY